MDLLCVTLQRVDLFYEIDSARGPITPAAGRCVSRARRAISDLPAASRLSATDPLGTGRSGRRALYSTLRRQGETYSITMHMSGAAKWCASCAPTFVGAFYQTWGRFIKA